MLTEIKDNENIKTDVEIIDELFLQLIEFSKKHILDESIKNEISPEQFKVLFQLYGKEKVNMNEIVENMYISNSASTILIDKLIKMELVERKRSDKDRRLVEVFMTNKGKELLSKIIQRRHRLINNVLDKLTEQEKKVVRESLSIFKKYSHEFNEIKL